MFIMLDLNISVNFFLYGIIKYVIRFPVYSQLKSQLKRGSKKKFLYVLVSQIEGGLYVC